MYMCKIFAMTNMDNVDLKPEFLATVRDAVCRSGDADGFGYATVDDDGNLYGERTVLPYSFIPLADPEASSKVRALPIVPRPTSDAFGERPEFEVKSFIAHGRLSTNTRSLPNTHPFTDGKSIALVHNGVVSDDGKVTVGTLTTDCDSEILLRLWEKAGMDAIEAHASGYYAIAALDSAGLLHIARDDKAKLFIAWSSTVESFLIATTANIIADIVAANDWECGAIEPLSDNIYAVFNGNTLEMHRSIKPIGYALGISSLSASRALGSVDVVSSSWRSDDRWTGMDDMPGYREEYEESYLDDLANDDGPVDAADYMSRIGRRK